MNSLMLHDNKVEFVKRMGMASGSLRQDTDSHGHYYLVAKIDTNDLAITMFSNSYEKPILETGFSSKPTLEDFHRAIEEEAKNEKGNL